jgi:hypothetical protein
MIGRRIEEDQIQTRSRELEKTKKTENYNTRERHREKERERDREIETETERWWQVVGRTILGGEVSEHMERRGGTLGSEHRTGSSSAQRATTARGEAHQREQREKSPV